ncbi:chemotaxis protein CheD [Lichenifustis flavocetrariae]|uniref:Probable chemoreceptor glutamine deamidase CheD n=1 Tax=Lichenifustis flavocetrariae TaxID=2949735 RepID=A0AA41YUX4_9HYPH|nr:chemotaxis protein CheD [Lichenifustis flavocetrariae]MCW6507661.1 chemotaxis protein CheD [Lichenifustis flavocetrariae]
MTLPSRPGQIGAAEKSVLVIQGEYKISDDPNVVLATLLGSCVAACIRDPLAGVGGMNHFLLAEGSASDTRHNAERYGVHAMELLVNGLLTRGAQRNRLEAKLFGGAKTMDGLADVGATNARFAQEFVRREGIKLVGECLLGNRGRRIHFWPVSGRARRIFMSEPVPLRPVAPPVVQPNSGALELF